MLIKGYVQGWRETEKPRPYFLDYWFDSRPDEAAVWKTKEEADIDCRLFDRHRIEIPASWGGNHICSGFKSEERKPGEFVVFCEAPFIPKQASAQ
jgi:hypothetical protein